MKIKIWNKKISRILVVTLIIALLVASTALITVYIQNKRFRDLEVEFVPETMNSCPDHVAWFLVSISFKGDDSEVEYNTSIDTNSSIVLDYKFWRTNSSPNLLELFLYPTSAQINQNIAVNVTIQAGDLVASDVAIMRLTVYI